MTPTTPAMTVQEASVSPSDPMVLLAGIKHFGLASDGSDLRDLETAIAGLRANVSDAERRAMEANEDTARMADRVIAVEARCGLMREALRAHWLTIITCDHAATTDTAHCYCTVWTGTPKPSVGEAVDEWIEHVMAILAYPGGKSDQGEKEKPPINLMKALREAIENPPPPNDALTELMRLGQEIDAEPESNPPAGGEGKPEPGEEREEDGIAYELRAYAADPLPVRQLGNTAPDFCIANRATLQRAAEFLAAPLSRSGDSALVEARELLERVLRHLPSVSREIVHVSREWVLLDDIIRWLAKHPEVQQHGERK